MSSENYGARVRAAQAYAGLDRAAFSKAIGIGERTVDRITTGERELTLPEARRIADVCDVPIAFLVHGWEIARPLQERVDRNTAALGRMEQRLDELTHLEAGELGQLIANAVARAEGQLSASAQQQARRR